MKNHKKSMLTGSIPVTQTSKKGFVIAIAEPFIL